MYEDLSGAVINLPTVHTFRVVPLSEKHPAFEEMELREYENEILRLITIELSCLEQEGTDIHQLDKQAIVKLLNSVKRELTRVHGIHFHALTSEKLQKPKKEPEKPRMIRSSPPDLPSSSKKRRSSDVSSEPSKRKDEHLAQHLAPDDKLDIDEAEQTAGSSASSLRQIGSGPFRQFEYSSSVPYDDALKRREFKQWIRAYVPSSGNSGFRVSFKKEMSDHIGITFTPINAFASNAKSNVKLLSKAVAKAESFMALPVVAQAKPFDPSQGILAKRLVTEEEFILLTNVPKNSTLVEAMIKITGSIVNRIFWKCDLTMASDDSPAYAVKVGSSRNRDSSGYNPGEIKDEILRAILKEVEALQNQGYDVYRLADDALMVKAITDNVRQHIATTFNIETVL
jgi:hypothetical protein